MLSYHKVTEVSPSLQHGVLSKEFVELMGHCNTIQAQYRDRNVERIQRQLKISECVEDGSVFGLVFASSGRSRLCRSLPPRCWAVA